MQGYRRDIDGLRAVAVLPVVFYHAGLPGFAGGFIGVDIFFVISGFLITSILARELDEGRFSLLAFYERRVRRIIPALVVMLVASAAMAIWLLLPLELKDFNFHLRGTLLFVSNFTLAEKLDYFAPSAERQALLHTWSLAVEEQFYILFPLLLWALAGRPRRVLLWVVSAIALISFAAAVWHTAHDPALSFFMPHVRFWELAVGALLALATWRRPSVFFASAAGVLGLGLIIWSVVHGATVLPFPGLGALAPVLGSALVIWSAAGPACALLSFAPFVWIGLISYSLYLWHWPVFVFWPLLKGAALTETEALTAVGLSVGLATLSLLLIERPFRRRSWAPRRPQLFKAGAVAGLALIAVTLLGDWTDGLPGRFNGEAAKAIAVQQEFRRGWAAGCLRRSPAMAARETSDGLHEMACQIGDPDAEPDFALWGDSHASVVQYPVHEAAESVGRAGWVFTHSACAPIPERVFQTSDSKMERCTRFNHLVAEWVRGSDVRTVILSGNWEAVGEPEVPAMRALLRDLEQQGREVIVVRSLPELSFDLPVVAARMAQRGLPPPTGPSTEAERAAHERRNLVLDQALEGPVVEISPIDVLCPEDICLTVLDGELLYADHDHLSKAGALLLTPLFEEALGGN